MSLAHPLAVRRGTAPYMTPEVERAFLEAVRLRAAHMVEVLSLEQRGPVLTGVLDTRTGRTFFGLNQDAPLLNLHPLLKERLADEQGRLLRDWHMGPKDDMYEVLLLCRKKWGHLAPPL